MVEQVKKNCSLHYKLWKNYKSLGNDGLTKEFHTTFCNEVQAPFLLGIERACLVKQLSASQKQAVIKLIKKKKKKFNKRYIQNWRPISLFSVDVKLISEALAEHLKHVLPKMISPNQNANIKNRFMSEEGMLISDLLEMSEVLKKLFQSQLILEKLLTLLITIS